MKRKTLCEVFASEKFPPGTFSMNKRDYKRAKVAPQHAEDLCKRITDAFPGAKVCAIKK